MKEPENRIVSGSPVRQSRQQTEERLRVEQRGFQLRDAFPLLHPAQVDTAEVPHAPADEVGHQAAGALRASEVGIPFAVEEGPRAERLPRAHQDVDDDVVPLGVAAMQELPVLAAHEEGDAALLEPLHGERDQRAGAEHAAQDRHAVPEQTVLEHLVLEALEAAQSKIRDECGIALDPQRARVREEAVNGFRDRICVRHIAHLGLRCPLGQPDQLAARAR
ncbi:hypothetical protein [Streptomyces luteogriseus]|uniref:hypothetical protein n=1 Tax=Streptomyces luteogriseus TaxID=68233 RepID=UPI0037A275F4